MRTLSLLLKTSSVNQRILDKENLQFLKNMLLELQEEIQMNGMLLFAWLVWKGIPILIKILANVSKKDAEMKSDMMGIETEYLEFQQSD